ncbi:hypothetical protein [Demequina sp. NBRC 110054]|uniref:hypothetical protein n=1 Tax=Demequina sp. NBRC 110054 TaxID=1570343 RepID=UPI0035D3F929
MVLATRSVPALDRLSSTLVAGLHGLRSPTQTTRHREELKRLADRVIPGLSDQDYLLLVQLAAGLGATDTARPIFVRREEGLPRRTPAGRDKALDEWRLRSASGGGRAGQIANAMRHAGWRERFSLLREYIWRNHDEFALDFPDVEDTPRGRLGAHCARLGRGFRSIKNLIRGYRFMKAGKDDTALVDGEDPWS